MFAMTFAVVSHASRPAFEARVDVLPADDDEGVDRTVAKERPERVTVDAVALVLELLHLDQRILHAAHALEVVARDRELLARAHDYRALLDRVARRHLHAVQAEQVGRLLEIVDDVVDLRRQLIDVLAVEGRYVLGVQEGDELPRESVSRRLDCLHLLLRHARVRVLAEATLDEPGHLERVLAGPREQAVELGRPGREADPHRAGR